MFRQTGKEGAEGSLGGEAAAPADWQYANEPLEGLPGPRSHAAGACLDIHLDQPCGLRARGVRGCINYFFLILFLRQGLWLALSSQTSTCLGLLGAGLKACAPHLAKFIIKKKRLGRGVVFQFDQTVLLLPLLATCGIALPQPLIRVQGMGLLD